ncbi:MAG: LamG domain-containing protein [Gemmatimonadota bacterium]
MARSRRFCPRVARFWVGAAVGALLVAGAATGQAAEGLVRWWPAEGTADDVRGGNDGLLSGAGFAPGMVGQAFAFDGLDDHVVIPNHAALNPARELTVEAWVYAAGKQGQQRDIVSKDGEGFQRQYALILTERNWFRARVGVPSGFATCDGLTRARPNTWYHVAMTYDGSELRLYVNGILDGVRSVSGALITTGQPVRIGGGAPGAWSPLYFQGQIDEVRIYDRALSAAEVIERVAVGEPSLAVSAIASQVISSTTAGLIPETVGAALATSLDGALAWLGNAQDDAAAGQLDAFIRQVEAQRGAGVMAAQAESLTAAALGVLDGLGAGPGQGGARSEASSAAATWAAVKESTR